MAETPKTTLTFEGQCPDCGERTVALPPELPDVGDDFDWLARDYDTIRESMLAELRARYPERRRWTAGDLEVVLVEALAAVLDQLSDMLDRVSAEATLATARRPESVRRLLGFIGYDALLASGIEGDAADLDALWLANPHQMDAARLAGPRSIRVQYRMVTVDDYVTRLEEHPLVRRATAFTEWSGSWLTVRVAVISWADHALDEEGLDYPDDLVSAVESFNRERAVADPAWAPPPTIRAVLRPFIDTYRMVDQEVILEDAQPVPVTMSISVRVADNYFRSEIRNAIAAALGTGPGGFFEPGRLQFGENLHVSDVMQVLTGLAGVVNVCLNRFKRIGTQFEDRVEAGFIDLKDLEIPVCDNDPARPGRGYYRLTLHGGRRG